MTDAGPDIADLSDRPYCPVCGTTGRTRYRSLHDRLFAVPGIWAMSQCSNPNCDAYWLNPAPVEKILPSFYVHYHTHTETLRGGVAKRIFTGAVNGYISRRFGYEGQTSLASALGRWIIAAIPTLRDDAAARVFWLPSDARGALLEVGFGSAATLLNLRSLGWRTAGVEFDPVSVEIAHRNGLEAFQGKLEEAAFPDAHFDAVVCSHVIEHLPDPVGFFRECARILKPNGRLALTTPNAGSLGHSFFAENWRGLEPPRHLAVFGPLALRRLASDAGFRKISVTTTNRAGPIIAQSVRLAVRADPTRVSRIEAEVCALLWWLISLVAGKSRKEELLLQCWR